MARKVYVTNDMSQDERVTDVAATEGVRIALLWPWFITCFDDWGRASADPRRIKASVFPMMDDVTPDVISEAIRAFARVGLILSYEAAGRRYIAIDLVKWYRYQTHIHKTRRDGRESRYPGPDDAIALGCAHSEPASDIDATPKSRASARKIAQTRGKSRKILPSPSPSLSPSPSPSLSDDEQQPRARAPARETPMTAHYGIYFGEPIGAVGAELARWERITEPIAAMVFQEASLQGARSWWYVKRIFERLERTGILDDADAVRRDLEKQEAAS